MSNVNTPSRVRQRAFTLVEVLVVILIIGVLATIAIPRLIGSQAKNAEVEAVAVKALVSAAAQRDALTNETLAIAFNAQRQELSLQALIEKEGELDWRPLPLTNPVRFGYAALVSATADGQTQGGAETGTGGGDFRIELGGARPRVPLSFYLRTAPDLPGTPRAWQVDLLPGQTVATLRTAPADGGIAPTQSSVIDLDAQGLRTQPW